MTLGKKNPFQFCPLHNLFRNLPTDCTISEKSLATFGFIFNSKVITGNATAPPPSEVMPKNKLRSTYICILNSSIPKYVPKIHYLMTTLR